MGKHALPFSAVKKSHQKPLSAAYPKNLTTIGNRIRHGRLEKGLLQEDVAKVIGVTTDCITNWENNRSEPQVQYYPKIIEFLRNNPFPSNRDSFSFSIKEFRQKNGLSHKKMGALFQVNASTISSWEKGKNQPKSSNLSMLKKILQVS